jgi:Na+-translocating ferredoxin:NAD+ oxidoreductase subunit C
LFFRNSFQGGIHLPAEKERIGQFPIEPLLPPTKVIIHLAQHVGPPAKPVVKHGDRVKVGQAIGEAVEGICAPVHASVSGRVLTVGRFPTSDGQLGPAIEIENDGLGDMVETDPMDKSWREAALGELINIISRAGVVDMDDSGMPTHFKLSPPSTSPIDTLIINGLQSEPAVASNSRLLVEKPEEIFTGMLIVKKILGAPKTIFAVDTSQTKVAAALLTIAKDRKHKDVSVVKLNPKYPQAAEKLLVQTLLNRRIPSTGAAADVGCIVFNVATIHAIFNAVCRGVPLYERVITISGPAVRSPKNLMVPIGTPLRSLMEFCTIDPDTVHKIIIGGAMTGTAQSDLDISVQKTTSSIFLFNRGAEVARRYACINCGHCVKTCPMRLVPAFLAKYVDNDAVDLAASWGITACIECGSCSYVCPSKIDLVHFIKLGKYRIARHSATHEGTIVNV